MGSIYSKQKAVVQCEPGFYEREDELDDKNHAQLLLDAQEFHERNPGTFDSLHKLVRDISPNAFEGGKVVIHVPVGEKAQVGLNWAYSDGRKNKFHTVVNFASSNSVRAYERQTAGSIEFDFSKNFGFNLMHYFTRNSLFRVQMQSADAKLDNAELALTYFGNSYSLSGSLANHSMSPSPIIGLGHFLYRINSNIDLGVELASDFSGSGIAGIGLQPSIAIKYCFGPLQYPPHPHEGFLSLDIEKQNTFLSILSLGHCQLFFKKHVAPGLQFLSSFMYNREGPSGQSSVTSFGYMYSLPKLDINMRSSFDTTATIQTTVEKQFKNGEDGMGVSFCVAHNFTENRTFTGLGVSIGK